MSHCEILLENRQQLFVDQSLLVDRLTRAIQRQGCAGVSLSIALVDDAEIRQVHREFMDQDSATDVISFLLNDDPDETGESGGPGHIDGELVVSVETARREAVVHGWSLDAELLLYCVHGFLHLCGYDDLTPDARRLMRQRERELMADFGLHPQGLQE